MEMTENPIMKHGKFIFEKKNHNETMRKGIFLFLHVLYFDLCLFFMRDAATA